VRAPDPDIVNGVMFVASELRRLFTVPAVPGVVRPVVVMDRPLRSKTALAEPALIAP